MNPKEKLIEAIKVLIGDFEKETGCQVTHMTVQREEYMAMEDRITDIEFEMK